MHVIVPDAVARRPDFLALAGRMREACGPALALHLRMPETAPARIYRLAAELAADARRAGGWLAVNERVDVALAAGAQAVQLGRGAISPADARAVVPPAVAIGVSVHDVERAAAAARGGANHVVSGTTFSTPSHPGRPPSGLRLLRAVAQAGLPTVAIGGITAERIDAVRGAGAAGIAVVRAVWETDDPVEAAAHLSAAWAEAVRGPDPGSEERR